MVTPESAGRPGIGPPPFGSTDEVSLDLPFDADDLYSLRSSVAAHAASLGASPPSVQRILIVASELSTNAVRHGGGRGRLRLWTVDRHLLCEVRDAGPGIADVATGTERPMPTAPSGRGLWISRQLSDDFALETGPKGTTVRVAIKFDGDGDDDDETDLGVDGGG